MEDINTNKLTEVIKDHKEWESIIKEYNNIVNNQCHKIDQKILNDIIHYIHEISDNYEDCNFECIIHLLNKISMYHSYDSYPTNVDSYLLKLCGMQSQDKPNQWQFVPILARELIIKYIINMFENYKTTNYPTQYDEIVKIHNRFFNSLFSFFNNISIYSLNYDPLLYDSLIEYKKRYISCCLSPNFETGFIKDGTTSKMLFDRDKFINAQNVLAFLHGHVWFIKLSRDLSIKSSSGEMELLKTYNYRERFKEVVDRFVTGAKDGITVNPSSDGIKGQHFNTYLVTGLDKIDAFAENPFAAYVHRYIKDSLEANCIVIVGTSLRDYHLNSFLVNFTVFDKYKKIVLVTTKQDLKYDLSDYENSIITKILEITGISISEEIKNKLDKFQDPANIKTIEYISENLCVYTNGVKNFYKLLLLIQKALYGWKKGNKG